MNDQIIISNTHFRQTEDGKTVAFVNLPDGDTYEQVVSSPEAVQKRMIDWCEAIRQYVKLRDQAKEEERAALKRRRKSDLKGDGVVGNTTDSDSVIVGSSPTPPANPSFSPKQMMIRYYDDVTGEADQLMLDIESMKRRLADLLKEIEKLQPIMEVWNETRDNLEGPVDGNDGAGGAGEGDGEPDHPGREGTS
jgi:DNA repair exonuclease SbcCD ATPase subunit